MNSFKFVMDMAIIFGVSSNVNKVFRAVGGNRKGYERIGGLVLGVMAGGWAARKFNNLADTAYACAADIFKDEEVTEDGGNE